MALAIIGGAPACFRTTVDLYCETAAEAGHDPDSLPVSINSHGFLADDAAEIAFPPFTETMTRIGRARGCPPTSRAQFDAETALREALFVGSPQEVIDKILYQYEIFRHQRFLMRLTVGPMPHQKVMRAIDLLGTEVAPVVRAGGSGD
jgi:alkanesulfonate monooxygenase SsuD/methylene tetrahydromethanopterin reductase-like flavin-dependent oxidoreductase (luciferase family)